MLIETFPVGPLQCNCSIIADAESGQAAVVDPGGDPGNIIKAVERHGLTVKYLLHTHAHFDHILGAKAVKEATGASICLHKEDQWLYDNLDKQLSLFGFKADEPLPVDRYLEDEETVDLGTLRTRVIHTPGHTPGSLCFQTQNKDAVLLLAGDTLFAGSIGRTDLWGGSFEAIIKSIRQRLLTLDDGTRVIPGHGPETDIWSEKRSNPFLA